MSGAAVGPAAEYDARSSAASKSTCVESFPPRAPKRLRCSTSTSGGRSTLSVLRAGERWLHAPHIYALLSSSSSAAVNLRSPAPTECARVSSSEGSRNGSNASDVPRHRSHRARERRRPPKIWPIAVVPARADDTPVGVTPLPSVAAVDARTAAFARWSESLRSSSCESSCRPTTKPLPKITLQVLDQALRGKHLTRTRPHARYHLPLQLAVNAERAPRLATLFVRLAQAEVGERRRVEQALQRGVEVARVAAIREAAADAHTPRPAEELARRVG
jgi:hypothetical protein